MLELVASALGGALITLGGAYITGFFKAKTDITNKKEEISLSANDQAFMMFKNLVSTLQKTQEEAKEDLEKLSQINIELREGKIEASFIIKALTKENQELIEQIKHLKASKNEQ